MNLIPPTQMGDVGDVGGRDENGLEHGRWVWVKKIRYLNEFGSDPYDTHMRMQVDYVHGIIIRAFLEYDVTHQHTQSWEEGRAISRPEYFMKHMDGMPFKRGLWRGKDKYLRPFVRMYGEQTVLWEYGHNGFRSAVLDNNGGFLNWVDDPSVRPPPSENEWPLEWDPYLRNVNLQKQWVPPGKMVDRRTGLELS